jgi:hypothetical protein
LLAAENVGVTRASSEQVVARVDRVMLRDRKFADSSLEEGVYCELVSENKISGVSISVRFWAILVS